MAEREFPIHEREGSQHHLALLELASETPQVIDDLWLISEADVNPYGVIAGRRLTELLESEGHQWESWEIWLSYNATRALNFLINPSNYPSEVYEELKGKIPQETYPSYTYKVPQGFEEEKGIWSKVKHSMLGLQVRMTPPGQRLPTIYFGKPSETTRVFPWQSAHLENRFFREEGLKRLLSKYIIVDGVQSYLVAVTPSEHPRYRKSTWESLEYCKASVIRGGQEHLFQMAAEKLEPNLETFEKFLASIRSK